jgi:hypothetical protein
METLNVGIREFRDKLASYPLKATCRSRLHATGIRLATTSRHGENAQKQTGPHSRKRRLAYRRCLRPKESQRTKSSRTSSNGAGASVNDAAQGLVLDANILLRAIFGQRVRK